MTFHGLKPALELQKITANISIWQAYDANVKADLFSTALSLRHGVYLVDPIPLADSIFADLLGAQPVVGIILTNGNHARAAADIAQKCSTSVLAHPRAVDIEESAGSTALCDGDCLDETLRVIEIPGAGPGEIALHYSANGGAMIVGDALINFEPHGFDLLPRKYCEDEELMRRSLRKLLQFDFEHLLFAHGTPITSNAKSKLATLLDVDRRRASQT